MSCLAVSFRRLLLARLLFRVEAHGAQPFADRFIPADLQDGTIGQTARDKSQNVGRGHGPRPLFATVAVSLHELAATVVGQDEGVQQRLGGQEFFVEQRAAGDRLRFVIQSDPCGNFGGVADKVREFGVRQDDQVRREPGPREVVAQGVIGQPVGDLVQQFAVGGIRRDCEVVFLKQ